MSGDEVTEAHRTDRGNKNTENKNLFSNFQKCSHHLLFELVATGSDLAKWVRNLFLVCVQVLSWYSRIPVTAATKYKMSRHQMLSRTPSMMCRRGQAWTGRFSSRTTLRWASASRWARFSEASCRVPPLTARLYSPQDTATTGGGKRCMMGMGGDNERWRRWRDGDEKEGER